MDGGLEREDASCSRASPGAFSGVASRHSIFAMLCHCILGSGRALNEGRKDRFWMYEILRNVGRVGDGTGGINSFVNC